VPKLTVHLLLLPSFWVIQDYRCPVMCFLSEYKKRAFWPGLFPEPFLGNCLFGPLGGYPVILQGKLVVRGKMLFFNHTIADNRFAPLTKTRVKA